MSERVLLEGSPTLGVEEEVAVAGCASAMWMIAGGKEGSRDTVEVIIIQAETYLGE